MISQKLLEIRKSMKARKPNFKIQNSNDPKKRFSGRWKRPKGLQSKIRERRKGNPRYIEPGYGSPAAVRGAAAEGVFPVLVRNISDLSKVGESQGIVISSTVGLRKKVEIAKAAVERNLKLLNVNPAALAKSSADFMSSRKKRRQELLQKRKVKSEPKKRAETAKAEAIKQPEKPLPKKEGADIEGRIDEDERKKAEKAEKDKILTKAK